MKTFPITLPDGKQVELLFTSLDAITLKKQFGQPMFRLFNVEISTDREVQAWILALGAKHKRVNVEVKDFLGTDSKLGWIDRYIAAGGDMSWQAQEPQAWMRAARAAAYYHGIVNGRVDDVDAPEADESDEGKGQETASGS